LWRCRIDRAVSARSEPITLSRLMMAARRGSCALSMRHGARSSHGRTRYGRFCLLRLDTGVMACSSSNIDGGYSGPEVGATASSTRTSAARFAVHLHTYARPSRRAFMARVGGRRVPGAGCDRFRPPTPYPSRLQPSGLTHSPSDRRTYICGRHLCLPGR